MITALLLIISQFVGALERTPSERSGGPSWPGTAQGEGVQTVFNNGNAYAVQNGPTRATIITLTRATRITKVTTYHWNSGNGQPAGTIALRSSAGTLYGPWPAEVEGRVYWAAHPGTTLPAGTYTVEDSSPYTWSQNSASNGAGMAWIEGSAQAPPIPSATAQTVSAGRSASVLFNGTLDDRWIRHSAAGGNFDRDARFEEAGGLVVRVPPNNGNGNVGLFSPKPLLWFDQAGRDAETSVTFRFDPERTTGFAVSLAIPNYGGVMGNPPGSPNVLLFWSRSVDGASSKLELHVNPHGEGAFRTIKLPPRAPREVTLAVRSFEIDWRVDGQEEIVDFFPEARVYQGFNVYVYSAAPSWHAPVSMALEEIVLNQRRITTSSPLTSIRKTALFEGRADPAWEPMGIAGGDFSRFAKYEKDILVVDVPKGNGWGKTGLLSVKPVLHVEARSDLAPYRFLLRSDPARTSGFVVALSPIRSPDMWPNHLVWASLIRNEQGRYDLSLHLSAYLFWTRTLPGRWNGELSFRVATDGVTVSVPGGPNIRAPLGLRDFTDYYAQIISHPTRTGEPSSLALKTFVLDRFVPASMPKEERWNFVAPEDFKADAFLRDLQNDLLWEAVDGETFSKPRGRRKPGGRR